MGVVQRSCLSQLFILFMHEVSSISTWRTQRSQACYHTNHLCKGHSSNLGPPAKNKKAETEQYKELARKGIDETARIKILQVGKTREEIHIYSGSEEMEIVSDYIYLGSVMQSLGEVDRKTSEDWKSKCCLLGNI